MSTEDPVAVGNFLPECDRANQTVEEWFPKGSTPRSEAFKKGAKAYLRSMFAFQTILCPYPPATAKHDAFFAGVDGARKLYRAMEGK